MATHFKGPLIVAEGDSTLVGSQQVDNLKLDGNTLSSTSGAINITPVAGSAIVLDTSVTVDGGVVAVTGDLSVDNLNLNGNTLSSASGAINITPVSGSAIVLDTSVSIDGGAVDITGDLDVDNININGNTIISSDTNGNINLTPNGTGAVAISKATVSASIAVGASGATIKKIGTGTIAIDPASIGDNDVGEVTATLTGVAAGDIVILVPPVAGITAGLMAGECRVSASDEIKVRIANLSGGAVDEASANWVYLWFDLT